MSVEIGASVCRLGWRWGLGERTLADVVKQVLPSLGELPPVGIEGIRLRSIYAEYFSAKDAAAKQLPPRDAKYGPPTRRGRVRQSRKPQARRADLQDVNDELDAEGL